MSMIELLSVIQGSGISEGRHPGGYGSLQDNIQSCEKIILKNLSKDSTDFYRGSDLEMATL